MNKPKDPNEQQEPKPAPEEIKQNQDDILTDEDLDEAAGGFNEMQ